MSIFELVALKRTKSNENGFSLIEVAFALIIISMIMIPLFMLYKAQEQQKLLTDTASKLARVETAINQFFITAGKAAYPCPSSLILSEGNANYGVSFATCDNLSTIRDCTDASWTTTDGLCKTSNNTSLAVLIGAVPFNDLGISPNDTLDVWGNKILYAVTYEQTKATTFNTNSGQLNIWAYVDDDNNEETPGIAQDITSVSNMPDFILLSHGSNEISAYTAMGNATSVCPTATNIRESKNCDFDNSFFLYVNPNNPKEGSRSIGTANEYYDDITRVQFSVPEATWFPHPAFPGHVMTLSTRVGIGTSTPKKTLDVQGNIRANGAVKVDTLCDDTNTFCFNPRFVTEANPCIGDKTAGVIQLTTNTLKCASAVNNSNNPISGEAFHFKDYKATQCSGLQVQQGFDLSGEPICVTK